MAGVLFTSSEWGNLGLRVGDTESDVVERRSQLRRSLSLSQLHFMNQTHSDIVCEVDSNSRSIDADAIFTREKGVGLAVLAADCLPILIKSDIAVAAVHAGRVGMVNLIAEKTIRAMQSIGASRFEAIIGPSICGDCYEVDLDMYEHVIADHPESATSSSTHCLNLQSGVAAQLTKLGVEVLNMGICTLEFEDFYSHRRSQSHNIPEGRQVGVISL
jgi:polyphenol oxidase